MDSQFSPRLTIIMVIITADQSLYAPITQSTAYGSQHPCYSEAILY